MRLPTPPMFPRKRKPRVKVPKGMFGRPNLVSASYDGATSVTLTFDRAINIDAIQPGAVVVDDGPGEATQYEGTAPATLTSPTTVEVPLTPIDSSSSAAVLLDASAANGIVAVGDGAAWPGVTDVELPFP